VRVSLHGNRELGLGKGVRVSYIHIKCLLTQKPSLCRMQIYIAPYYVCVVYERMNESAFSQIPFGLFCACLIPARHQCRYAERAFAVAGPMSWNSLPTDIRDSKSLTTFRRLLKRHNV
jgi:hypothetical protein